MKRAAGCWLVLFMYQSVLAQTPSLVLPVGHTSSVSTVAFSDDNKYVVTASWDNTAKIWLSPEGRLINDLKGHSASLTSAKFSHNGKYVVTTSKDSTAIIWLAQEARIFHKLKAHQDWVSAADFSADDKLIATASWDNTVAVWQVTTGKLLTKLTGHTGPVNSVQFTRNNKFLLTSSKDSTARLWSVTDGKLLHTFRHGNWVNTARLSHDDAKIVTASHDSTCSVWSAKTGTRIFHLRGHTAAVNDAAFNDDASLIISGSNDNQARVWDAQTGLEERQLEGHDGAVLKVGFASRGMAVTGSSDHTVRAWNAQGSTTQILNIHSAAINDLQISSKTKYLASASMDNSALIWNLDEGKVVGRLVGHTSVVTSAAYSSDGNYLVTASWDNTAKIWSAHDGKLLTSLKGHTDWINTATFSPDGNLVVTASSDNTARIWSVPEGKLLQELRGHSDWVASAIFSHDSRYIATTSWDNTARIFEVSTGLLLTELRGHSDYVKWINFSSDDRMVVTASADNTARLWSTQHGKLIHVFSGHSDKVRTIDFSNDDQLIITSSYDSTARIWETSTGSLKMILRGHMGPLNGAILSPDGKHVTTFSMDNTARVWALSSGTIEFELKAHANSINSAHYSRDGKRIVLGSWDNTASTWDAQSGKLLHIFKGHDGIIKSAAFTPDGKFIVTTSEDNTLKKWNAETGKFLYTFFAVDSTDYLAIDNDGHYDGSANARNKLYYVCGNELIDLEQFKELSWEPGLVAKLTGINTEPITAKKITEISICNFTPQIDEGTLNRGTYTYYIRPRKGGLGQVQLFVNGKMVRTIDPASLVADNGRYILKVSGKEVGNFLASGVNNYIVVKATTRRQLMTSRGAAHTIPGPRKPVTNPDMYLVSIGVSEYKGEKLKLKYAAKDAVDFTAAMTASAEKLLNGDGKRHVNVYEITSESGNNRRPSKQSILAVIDTISQKATPDDIVVIFFAGHGVLQTGDKKFYLLTADASQTEMNGVEKEVAISTDELNDWLRRIRANKQVLILDACNSGQVVNQFQQIFGRRNVPADQQRALENLKDKTGTFILCASAAGQAAYETSLYGQGLLTYSLLSGLKFGNGLRDNKYIDVTRWFNYASENVKTLAREIGGRQDPQIIGNASFEIGIVDKDVVNQIQLAGKKQVFRTSRFIQDEDLLDDELDLSVLVDRELNNASASARQAPWVFVADNTLLDAFSIRGKYHIKSNEINVKVSVYRGQKERVHQFEVTGTTQRKEDLAKKIVETTKSFMSQLAKTSL